MIKSSITLKALLLISIPVLFQLVFVMTLTHLLHESDVKQLKLARSRAIVSQVHSSIKSFYEVVHNAASFFDSKKPRYRKSFERAFSDFESNVETLIKMLDEDAATRLSGERMRRRYDQLIEQITLIVTSTDSKVQDNSIVLHRGWEIDPETNRLLDNFLLALNDVAEQERKKALEIREPDVHGQEIYRTLIIGAILNFVIGVFIIAAFNATIANRIKNLRTNSTRLLSNEKLLPPEVSSDEIGELGRTLYTIANFMQEASRKERAVVENASDVIMTISNEMSIVAVNPACKAMLGYEQDELVGLRLASILSDGDANVINRLAEAKRSAENRDFEANLRRSDGKEIVVLCSTHYSAEERSYFCVLHDITFRKKAEELLRSSESRVRALIENVPVGIALIGRNGRFESLNPMAAKIFRCSESRLSGIQVESLFRNELAPFNPVAIDDFTQSKSFGNVITVVASRFDGTSVPLDVVLSQIELNGEQKYLMTLVDVTERKQAEQLKQDFVAMVSHDLRSPLASVQGFLEMLDVGVYGELTDKGEDRLKIANRNIGRLLTLISDLLDIERLQSGAIELERQSIDAARMARSAQESLLQLAESRCISLTCQAESHFVMADEGRISQVLTNIISNALKFSPENSCVDITGARTESALESTLAPVYRFAIKDKGPGLTPDEQSVVFERFKQVGGAASRKKGSGLGLAICKAIVLQHGGEIGVDSLPGQGSTFWFTLPLADGDLTCEESLETG